MAKRLAKLDVADAPAGPAWSENLVGHEAAEKDFLRAMARSRLPHAWMITGIKGVGKATLAYRIARRLLRSDQAEGTMATGLFGMEQSIADSLELPATDPIFRRVAQQVHPDFRVLERTINPKSGRLRTEIVVEDVRGIIDFLRLKPSMGGWRVVIVDSADELNRNAANALLKILEEPPARSVLLLLANAPKALLPTLVSRCRILSLRPLDEALIASALLDRFPALDGEQTDLISLLAEGSLGRAMRIAAGDGAALFRELAGLLGTWPRLEVRRLHGLADRMLGKSGEGVFELSCEILGWWFGRFVWHAARSISPDRDLFAGEGELMTRMARNRGLEAMIDAWEQASDILDKVRRVNMDRRQAWIAALIILSGQAA